MNMVKIYSVKDLKAETFAQPWFQRNDALAMRAFGQIVENPETDWHKWHEDYSLYSIGEFNTETAEIIPHTPNQIANASDYISK
jgi:hypothetical protein